MAQAVSLSGRLHTGLTAFNTERPWTDLQLPATRRSWAQTLKSVGPDDTVVPGDVVVTEQHAKQSSQPRSVRMETA